jgi:hypothetical protein
MYSRKIIGYVRADISAQMGIGPNKKSWTFRENFPLFQRKIILKVREYNLSQSRAQI